MTNLKKKLQCEMEDECSNVVTHIEDKGYIYCAEHARERRMSGFGGRCRKMRPHELRRVQAGLQIKKY